MLQGLLLMEAIHSTALSCGCGSCTACRASAGDEAALASVFLAVSEATRGTDDEERTR